MRITRKIDKEQASYDLLELKHIDILTIKRALDHFASYTRHCPPAEDDELYNKITKILDFEQVTISPPPQRNRTLTII